MSSKIWILWSHEEDMAHLFALILTCLVLNFQPLWAFEISKEDLEDLEIINNLTLLENMDILEEDVTFLEEYEEVKEMEEDEGKSDE